MANPVIRFFLLISSLAVKGVEGAYCSYYSTYYTNYRYCPFNSYSYFNLYGYGYLTGGTIAGIVIGVIVAIGVIIALIVACCVKAASNGGRATRGRVVQPNQPTVFTTTNTQAYPTHAYPQAPPTYPQGPPPYMQPQPVFQGYPPPGYPGSSNPPNAVPPPPVYNNPAGPK